MYGSGLLSSHGELEHCIESRRTCSAFLCSLEWVINQGFEIDHYQPLLFVVRDFTHLFELVDQLDAWMRAGKLNNVAPGEPAVSPSDVMSFLTRSSGVRTIPDTYTCTPRCLTSAHPTTSMIVRPDDPEYVAWRRRMADKRPSRGGPRQAGEVMGGLAEQCVQH